MTELSARLALPLMQAGQAQKEITHNEALALIDLGVAACVTGVGRNDPPAEPAVGECWILGSGPSGAWTGQTGALAGWTEGGWRFLPAREGLAAWDMASGCVVRRANGAWVTGELTGRRVTIGGRQVVGERGAAIPGPAGGAVVDAEARAAVERLLSALRTHGLIAE